MNPKPPTGTIAAMAAALGYRPTTDRTRLFLGYHPGMSKPERTELETVRDERDALAARVLEMHTEVTGAIQHLRDHLQVLVLNRDHVAEMALPLQADLPLKEMRESVRAMEARLHRLERVVASK